MYSWINSQPFANQNYNIYIYIYKTWFTVCLESSSICSCIIYNNILAEGRIADALKYGFLDLDEDMIKGMYYAFFFSANLYSTGTQYYQYLKFNR